jgi:hypothetical protein
LLRGCRPRVEGAHKAIVTAQFEVAEGKVSQLSDPLAVAGEPAGTATRLQDDQIIVQTT